LDSVRALLFDVFGTVVDWRGGVARAAVPFLLRHAGTPADPAAFADTWRDRYQPAMEEVRSGRRPFVALDVLHRENLEAILPDFGIVPARVPAQELDELNHAWHRLDPWPDVLPGLTRLKTRYIIAPLSNGNVSLMTNLAKFGGLPWDCILGAELARHYKPDREVYQSAADFLDLAPNEIVMVAAHQGDLRAARGVGLETAFVPRPLEFGPAGKPDLNPDPSFDVVAADFNDLAAQLGT
jgi:2-haloacid dehalogenase